MGRNRRAANGRHTHENALAARQRCVEEQNKLLTLLRDELEPQHRAAIESTYRNLHEIEESIRHILANSAKWWL